MKVNFYTIYFNPIIKKVILLLLLLPSFLIKAQSDSLTIDTSSVAINSISNDSLTIDTSAVAIDSSNIDTLQLSPDAVESKVRYVAKDSIRFDMKTRLVYLFGSSEVYYEDIVLKAEEIEINIDSNTVTARGKLDSTGKFFGEPVFTEAGKEMKSHEMKYNFDTKKGIIIDAFTHEGENYVHGEKIYKTSDDILYFKNAKYTTCNLEHPHYYFRAGKLKIIPKDKIVTGPANLFIEDTPTPLAIPFGFFPNTDKQKSGLIIPSYGESAQYGFFLLNGGLYLGISDNVSMKFTGDFYTKGNWSGNFSSDYKNRYRYKGNFNVGLTTSKNGIKELPDYNERKDFFIQWDHDQRARPNSIFSAKVKFGTSQNFINNINSSASDFLSNNFNSSISYKKSWAGKPFNLSVNASHSQNIITETATVRLPEMAFSVSRIFPFKKKVMIGKQKFYEKIGISYLMNTKNEVTAKDSLFGFNYINVLQKDFKNGMRHSIPLGTSFKLLKHFTLSPSINYSEVWYTRSIIKNWNNQTKTVDVDTSFNFIRGNTYGGSINLATRIYGMYQFNGKVIKALRHVITPSASFSYTPENLSTYRSYTDSNNTDQEYSIFENGIYGTSGGKETGFLNLSLINNFEMKVRNRKDSVTGDKKIKLIDNLRFSSSYNTMVDSLNWSKVKISARTNIFKRISINFSTLLDPYAIDSSGSRINTPQWEKSGDFGRITSSTIATSFSLRSKEKKNEKNSPYGTEEELEYIRANPDAFIDFNVPWNIRFSYILRYSKPKFESKITQVLNFSGDFSLTKKWKIGFRSGYDFKNKDLSYTTVDFYRDLHCWEMMFNWVPFGQRQSYTFTIKVKSALLQDLKLTRRNLPNVFY